MVKTAYARSLKLALADKCSAHHYATDFATLWSDEFAADQPIIIVWDRAARPGPADRDSRLLEPHLTPLDWALAWSLKLAGKGHAVPAVVIVDTGVGGWGDSWAWRVRRQLLADLPWVTLAAPLPPIHGAKPAHEWLIDLDNEARGIVQREGAGWTVITSWTPRRLTPREQRVLIDLNALWAASLSHGDEHHDINNIVTPLMLLTDPEELDDDAARAMLQRLHWTGLRIDSVSPPPAPTSFAMLGERPLRLVLIDDRARRWAPVLSDFTGTDYTGFPPRSDPKSTSPLFVKATSSGGACEIWAADTIHALRPPIDPDQLRRLKAPRRLHFTDPTFDEVLVVDLDLGAPTVDAYDPFIAAAQALDANGRSAQLWRRPLIPAGFDVAGWAKAARGSAEWQDLLTLPVRVVATIDPTLPIILFAATTQRRIIESLKPFHNIVTGFDKPQLLGPRGREAVEAARSRWVDAVARAIDVLRVRRAVGLLGSPDDPSSWLSEASNLKVAELRRGHPVWVDIFFDETGSQHERDDLEIGALAIFGNRDDRTDYAYGKLIEELVERARAEADGGDHEPVKEKIRNQIDRRHVFGLNSFLSFSRLKCKSSILRDLTAYYPVEDRSSHSDITYRMTMQMMMEILIFHHVARVFNNRPLNLRIHTANLCYPVRDYNRRNGAGAAQWEKWSWGTETIRAGGLEKISFISDRDAKGMVLSVMKNYKLDKVKVVRARSFTLNGESKETVPVHYLIDRAVSSGELKVNGFQGSFSAQVAGLLHSAQRGANGDLAVAVASSYEALTAWKLPSSDVRHVANRLRAVIARHALRMTGADFAEAGRLIAAYESRRSRPPVGL